MDFSRSCHSAPDAARLPCRPHPCDWSPRRTAYSGHARQTPWSGTATVRHRQDPTPAAARGPPENGSPPASGWSRPSSAQNTPPPIPDRSRSGRHPRSDAPEAASPSPSQTAPPSCPDNPARPEAARNRPEHCRPGTPNATSLPVPPTSSSEADRPCNPCSCATPGACGSRSRSRPCPASPIAHDADLAGTAQAPGSHATTTATAPMPQE